MEPDTTPHSITPDQAASQCLAAAQTRHRDGRFADAVRLYAVLLEADPDNAGLLSVAGLAALQAGDPDKASVWLERAATSRPDDSAIRANLAGALLQRGEPMKARDALKEAIRLSRRDPRMWTNLGNVEETLDNAVGAAAAYQAAAALDPQDPVHWANLGRLHFQRGQTKEAAFAFGRARQLRPDDAATVINHAVALEQAGNGSEAVEALEEGCLISPSDAAVHTRLGMLHLKRDAPVQAVGPFARATELAATDPDNWLRLSVALSRAGDRPGAHRSLDHALALSPDRGAVYLARGNLHWDAGEVELAAEAYEDASRLRPDVQEIWFNRGNAAKALGQMALAETCFLEAARLDPENPLNHCQLSHLYLSMSRWKEGFSKAEWRWRLPKVIRPDPVAPVWQGEDLAGKRIVVRAEQGYGDTIQFVRMTRDLGAASVHLEVQTPLVTVLRSLPWEVDVLEPGTLMPEMDYEICTLSLPAVRGFDPGSAGDCVPYLRALPAAVERWRALLSSYQGLRTGLVWAGNPDYPADKDRSIPVELIATLDGTAGVTFFPLQLGGIKPDWLAATNLTDHLTDFAETAACLENLDLVIAVDTAIAHLAGAMGRPVWMLNRFDGDWRWLHGRDDTIWYPTMRLFRQDRHGDWRGVIDRVRDALAERAEPIVGDST